MTALAILDLGYGNVDSIRLAFARLGVESVLTADPAMVRDAERLVLPGVGAAGSAMGKLRAAGLVEPLRARSCPMLGICLGMQMMFEASDEGDTPLLGLLGGQVRALVPEPGRPVPHMGWNRIEQTDGVGLAAGDYVYFAHSFACDDGPSTIARADYGRAVPAVVKKGNWTGAQFHPERSGPVGARFIDSWLKNSGPQA